MNSPSSTVYIPAHPSLFMVDYLTTKDMQGTIAGFNKTEPNYDIAFWHAWKISAMQNEPIKTPKGILALFDRIHDVSLEHLKPIKEVEGGYIKIHGKVDSYNWFDVGRHWNCDEQGLSDIIHKVWNESNGNLFLEMIEENMNRLLFDSSGLYQKKAPRGYPILTRDPKNSSQDNATFEKIKEKIFQIFNLPERSDGQTRINFVITSKPELRALQAKQIVSTYLEQISSAQSDDEKLKVIAIALRNLMQLHMYFDGNGRTIYIFTNFLLEQNGLALCYPKNMSFCDAYSIDRIVAEIKEGQVRFKHMFESKEKLCSGLEEYVKSIEELKEHIDKYSGKNKRVLEKTFDDRDLNLLLRRASAEANCYKLIQFLLEHKAQLNIDPHAKGETSKKNALDVALSFGNSTTANLLKLHGINPTTTK